MTRNASSGPQDGAPIQPDTGIGQIAAAVAEHPFLQGMSNAHLDLMVSCATLVDFRPGDLVFKQGDPANRFYLIVWGSVSLTHAGLNHNVPVQTLCAGDVLGWSWMFPPYAWHFNAMVTELTRAIVFDGERLRSLCREQYDFGYELLTRISQVLIERLQRTRRKCFKLSGHL